MKSKKNRRAYTWFYWLWIHRKVSWMNACMRLKKFVSNIRKLIRTAREQGIEVVYVQHDDWGPARAFSIGDDEFEVYSGFAPLLTEKTVRQDCMQCVRKKKAVCWNI